MQDLIDSYRESVRNTKRELDIRKQLNEYQQIDKNDTADARRQKVMQAMVFAEKHGLEKYYTMQSNALNEDIQILQSMLTSMRFSLSMMNKELRVRRGIERRAKSEREIPVETERIYKRQDKRMDIYEADDEQLQNEKEAAEHKERLVNSMTEVLTDRQKEILELAASGYTHKEIAEKLSIAEGTVSSTLTKSKEKIRNEGWLMV